MATARPGMLRWIGRRHAAYPTSIHFIRSRKTLSLSLYVGPPGYQCNSFSNRALALACRPEDRVTCTHLQV